MKQGMISNLLKCSLFMGAFLVIPCICFAHGSGTIHVREMYSVLPFAANEDGSALKENADIERWLRLITSELIDNYKGRECEEFGGRCFYQYLNDEFGFHCKHRLLFHWGYNSRPWSDALDAKISQYEWSKDPQVVETFKKTFAIEQARRNRLANSKTEDVFGFSSSGKESAWANGIIAIVYDVHLLGDYVPYDNSDFDGVMPPSKVIGDIVNALNRIDAGESKYLKGRITTLAKSTSDENELSIMLIKELQKEFPRFLLSANKGAIKQKFQMRSFVLKEINGMP